MQSAAFRWPSVPAGNFWSAKSCVSMRARVCSILESMYVDFAAYRPIGRLFGNLYTYQREPFAMDRESHAQWAARVPTEGGEPKE